MDTSSQRAVLSEGNAASEISHGNKSVDGDYRQALQFHREGHLGRAESLFRDILVTDPRHAGSLHFLGVIHLGRNEIDTAITLLEQALSLNATKPVFHNNYGVALKQAGRLDEAEKAFERAISFHAAYADALSNRGLIALLQNRLVEAEQFLKQALAVEGDHADARRHLSEVFIRYGNEHAQKRDFSRAEERFEAACRVNETDFVPLLALASSQADQDKFEQAEANFTKAASLSHGKSVWRFKRLGFCPSVFENETEIEDYWHRLHEELDRALASPPRMDWRFLSRDGFTPSFNLPHLNFCCREVKEKFAAFFRHAFSREKPKPRSGRQKSGRTRIGLVVTEGHETGFKRVMDGIVQGLNRDRFDVEIFCCEKNSNLFKNPVLLSNRLDAASETIRNKKCDLLYHWKVGGGPLDYFLPFTKCAPVQCTGYGTHGTSGVSEVDYYISSSTIESPDADSHYTENLYRFPEFPTFHTKFAKPENVKRKEFPVPKTGTLYFCPLRIPKYHPSFDEYLQEILERDQNGTLLLLSGGPECVRERLQARLSRRWGKALMRRVVFFASIPNEIFYRLMAVTDVVLDSPVYAGDLTTHDAFSFGIPVVTQKGPLLVQRYTSGLYEMAGLGDLVAHDRQTYVDTAVRLGTDSEFRHVIGTKIREQCDRLFGSENLVRDFETFIDTVCDKAAL